MYTKIANCCAAARGYDAQAVVVSAGDACAGLCGIELPDAAAGASVAARTGEDEALPQTIVVPQAYAYGFCPDEALQRGTMFPELVG